MLISSFAVDHYYAEKPLPILTQINVDAFCLNGEVSNPKTPKEKQTFLTLSPTTTTQPLEKSLFKTNSTLTKLLPLTVNSTETYREHLNALTKVLSARAPPF